MSEPHFISIKWIEVKDGFLLHVKQDRNFLSTIMLTLYGCNIVLYQTSVIVLRNKDLSVLRYLYKKLQGYDPKADDQLFEAGPQGKLRVKEGVTFHMYISTAPCGDGALFSPR